MGKTVAIATLGCKVNQYESEALEEQFARSGYTVVDFSMASDVYVINTCTVTHLSDRKSRQMIRRAKQLNPAAVLVVMGCYAQTNPEAVKQIAGVDIVIGTAERSKIVKLVEDFFEEKVPVDLVQTLEKDAVFELLAIDGSMQKHTRVFVKVQDGCNQFCSYCIIPYARGRIRSRSIIDTVTEAKRLADAGFCELVLTGIHLASWGKDSGEGTLLTLLEALEKVSGIERIRLGSLEPTLCDDAFVEGISRLSKVCHHFHLSLQSGCDKTLKRMNRKYTSAEYFEAVQRIRSAMPDAAITTDVIVGFPGETDEDFEESYSFVKSLELADAHIFKYSPRNGTPAAKMPEQVTPEEKEERSNRLIALSKVNSHWFSTKYVGQTEDVLFEQTVMPGVYEGKTKNYISVRVSHDENIIGKVIPVYFTICTDGVLYGNIVEA